MKTNLFNYNSILFTLIIILISTITIWKLPQPQNEYTHIGIAVYDMDDTFMSDYIDKLQNELETCTFNGKKILICHLKISFSVVDYILVLKKEYYIRHCVF